MDLIITNIIGLGVGVGGSWLFFRYQLYQKPKISFSPKIARGKSHVTDNTLYRVKIVNDGSHQVIDLRVKCGVGKLQSMPGGSRLVVERIKTLNEEMIALDSKKVGNSEFQISSEWTVVLHPIIPLEEKMRNGNKLLITLRATDAISGSTIAIRHIFSLEDIVDGDFCAGRSFDIYQQT